MKQTCSIALITYNGEKYLVRQLETLAEQTRLPDELVVCDDGSTDKTVEILEDFAKTAPFPVRIYQNEENLGYSRNFHKVFFLCEKNITFFCDQDDVWLPEKIASAMKIFEEEPEVGLVLMTDLRVDKEEKPLPFSNRFGRFQSALEAENGFWTLLKLSALGWAAHNMACRTCWREVAFPEIPTREQVFDLWLYHVLGAVCDVRVILEPTVWFRRHGENVTSQSRNVKNPLVLLRNSIRKHYSIDRLWQKYRFEVQLVKLLHETREVRYPEVVEFYERLATHLKKRVDVRTQWLSRFWLVPCEYFNGNYGRFARGFRDALTDFIAWRQKLPK